MARAIQEAIYDNWYGNVNSVGDGVFRLNSKLYFIRNGNYQALEYMNFKILEMHRGEYIQINKTGYGGKLFSATDCNYIRGAGYDLKIKGGKVIFLGYDVTQDLIEKGYARVSTDGKLIAKVKKSNMLDKLVKANASLGTVKKKALKANDLKKIKNPLYKDIIEDFMQYVGGTAFEIAGQEGKNFLSGFIICKGGNRFVEETAEEFSEAYGVNIDAWDDQRGIGISIGG